MQDAPKRLRAKAQLPITSQKWVIWLRRSIMKRFLAFALVLGLCSFGVQLFAQQGQQRPGEAGAAQQQPSQQQTDAEKGQSAQSFQGKIAKSGNQLVFQDSATQTAY